LPSEIGTSAEEGSHRLTSEVSVGELQDTFDDMKRVEEEEGQSSTPTWIRTMALITPIATS
jgi:hypothetical protein